eukprot:m.50879 g.50879  ORF g.50879 m.50879 type:complete len:65 (+) comp34099_c0_seq17:1574-1768(+)
MLVPVALVRVQKTGVVHVENLSLYCLVLKIFLLVETLVESCCLVVSTSVCSSAILEIVAFVGKW